jgi:uncharacterized OB-fold protein
MTSGVRPPTLPTAAPKIDPEVLPYWQAAARGDLVLPRCATCDRLFWYPRGACPRCMSHDITWEASPGRGVVYSFSVVRRAAKAWGDATPYVLAYVTLDEGITLVANLVDCDPADIEVGLPVAALFERADDGETGVLRFAPAHGRLDVDPTSA